MESANKLKLVALAVLAAALVLPVSHASAQDDAWRTWAPERETSGVRVHIDNDLFAARNLDRDYTGGVALTLSGTAARDGLLSLDPVLSRIDQLFSSSEPAAVRHARQIGLIAFTPSDILTGEAQQTDRPYASLLFASNGRVRVEANDRRAWSSSLTVGVLGLHLTETLHDLVHEAVGSDAPQGYDHQISAGGEPTARYMLARHDLVYADPTGRIDVKTTLAGSVGFLTETSAAISMRIGRFDTPWWSFAPELADYIAAPTPVESLGVQREVYFFAGARVTARAYNAFLQGQFRESDVRYSYDEIEPIVAQAWIGVMTQLFPNTELSYALHYQTAELRDGKAARDAFWGGVQLAHSF
ncbi:MAG TPA: lipid A deacylase LpxR family protein [Steroidobacteraceae bacterium]|nr:lipid A deacylase LpxR family protein [Steroidobacteraceae bacterium]